MIAPSGWLRMAAIRAAAVAADAVLRYGARMAALAAVKATIVPSGSAV
jgi:hypothetical protein